MRLRLFGLLMMFGLVSLLGGAGAAPSPPPSAPTPKRSAKEALQTFQSLIGSWRGTGEPYGSREEKLKGFWQEKIGWQWQFKGADTFLLADFAKGKHFTKAELRYRPDRDVYELKAVTAAKETWTFEGKYAKPRLTLERTDPKTKRVHRLVFSFLHSNRYLYRYEARPADHTVFTQVYQVGATKEGVAFASEDGGPECVVSGGLGTMPVMHGSKTYYVCCTGCRDAFKEQPDKYVKEFEARMRAKKK
jgi:hypothetical protein